MTGREPEETPVRFFSEEVKMPRFERSKTASWLMNIAESEDCSIASLSIVFCSDDFLHSLNIEYLNHDTLTDIITFPFAGPPEIEGELYISTDRIKENAEEFRVPFATELHRVMAHGLLHLIGFGDKDEAEQKLMREREDFYLRQIGLV